MNTVNEHIEINYSPQDKQNNKTDDYRVYRFNLIY